MPRLPNKCLWRNVFDYTVECIRRPTVCHDCFAPEIFFLDENSFPKWNEACPWHHFLHFSTRTMFLLNLSFPLRVVSLSLLAPHLIESSNISFLQKEEKEKMDSNIFMMRHDVVRCSVIVYTNNIETFGKRMWVDLATSICNQIKVKLNEANITHDRNDQIKS